MSTTGFKSCNRTIFERLNVLLSKIGHLSSGSSKKMSIGWGIPGIEIWTYNDVYEDNTGALVSFMGTDDVVLTSPAVQGVRAFGAIMDRKANWAATPIFPKMYEQEDPSGLFLLTQSAPLMIPMRPDATMRVTVNNAS